MPGVSDLQDIFSPSNPSGSGTSTLRTTGSTGPFGSDSNGPQPMGTQPPGFNTPLGGGSNQYGNYPTIPPGNPAGVSTNPTTTTGAPPAGIPGAVNTYPNAPSQPVGTEQWLGASNYSLPTNDPQFTAQFYSWLQQQLGTGLPAFGGSSQLPGGGSSAPGSLTAPNNQILQQLMSMFSGGSTTIPGGAGLEQMAQTGNPVDQTPAWQAAVQAQQQNIQQNAADLKEQFAFGGNLQSSPFATGMANYYEQTAQNQNALLAQMQSQSLENAAGRQLTAQQGLTNEASSVGQYLQGLDQSSIDRMYQQFMTDLPQNNPLMQMLYGSAMASPGVVNDQQQSGITGAIAALLGGGGAAMSGLGALGFAI